VADKILIQVTYSASCRHATPNDVLQRHRRQIEILTTKGNPTPELIDKLAPGLVRNVLRRAGAVDCAKANLPKPLMRRLDLMCQLQAPRSPDHSRLGRWKTRFPAHQSPDNRRLFHLLPRRKSDEHDQ
jgi:hypothetical protein